MGAVERAAGARATSASATCCPPRPTTTGSSPATSTGWSTDRRHGDDRDADDDTDRVAVWELGLGRARGCCRSIGRDDAVDRWYSGEHGPTAPIAEAAPAHCATCGFLTRWAASLRRVFGVCANDFSPSDGRVVSYDHGCGAHSEVAVLPGPVEVTAPRRRRGRLRRHLAAPGRAHARLGRRRGRRRGPRPLLTATVADRPFGTASSCAPACSPPGPPRPPGSARTPTPRTTSSAAATATASSSSSRRTPPTRPPAPVSPGRLTAAPARRPARRRRTPGHRWTRPASSRCRRCGPRPSGKTARRRRAASASVSRRCSP